MPFASNCSIISSSCILNAKLTSQVSQCATLRAGLYHGPWNRTMEDGLFPWVDFVKKKDYKAFGPLAKCKPSVTKRNDHAPKVKVFFNICAKREVLKKKEKKIIQVWPLFCLLLCSSSLPKKNLLKFFITIFLYHGPLPFPTIAPLLSLPPQNILDYVSGWCRPKNMSFGNLKLHDHIDMFSLV